MQEPHPRGLRAGRPPLPLTLTLTLTLALTPHPHPHPYQVGLLFLEKYGTRCGWAHCLLFAAELPQFRKQLPAELQREMEAFKAGEKEQKAREKERIKLAREAKLAAKGGKAAAGKGSDLLAPDYDLEGAEGAEGAGSAAADATLAKPKPKRRPPKATPSEPRKRKARATRAEGEVVD